ncbi:CvpA family protein [Desulfonatronovibrio hydrogenovorans]|uniref:CvpA family protein n=1 Tax=Desulfonatronovibrio hydrogenovorans TaxID=53245 RepID=UPI00048E5A0B|nr:CvpA family protein [Desulfonatronovibrio hydrogenovorans]
MNGLDIFFVVVLGFFLFRGIFRGLILEVSSIVGLIAGFLAANRFYADLQPVAGRILPNPDWAQIAAYLGIFLTTMFIVGVFSLFLKNLLRMIMLGWLDRIGGGVLGFIKAGLICSLTLLVMTVFLPKDDELISTSKVAPYVHTLSQSLADYLPGDLKGKFLEKADTARLFWEESWEELTTPQKDKEDS